MPPWVWEFLQHEGIHMLRILLAALLGFIVGVERTRRQKEAGYRTHVIVAIGSALVMVVSKYGFVDMIAQGVEVDPTRIASNIVTGIGFLGAGVIFVKDVSIRGLTTAAGLWATAAVGMAVGAGMYAVGVFVTLLIILVQFILHHINRTGVTTSNHVMMRVRYSPQIAERIRTQLASRKMHIENFRVKKANDNILSCTFEVRMPQEYGYDELLFLLDENEDILELDM